MPRRTGTMSTRERPAGSALPTGLAAASRASCGPGRRPLLDLLPTGLSPDCDVEDSLDIDQVQEHGEHHLREQRDREQPGAPAAPPHGYHPFQHEGAPDRDPKWEPHPLVEG